MLIKDLTDFPKMIKHEKHIIDNKAKISDNSNEFLRFLVKSLKIKFLHTMRRSMRMKVNEKPHKAEK